MEPVTHILTGACLARSGFNRRVAYATAGMAIAAEFPDVDTLWGLGGPVKSLEHHRGITHTFVGIPFEAAFLLLCFYGYHRWRSQKVRSPRERDQATETPAQRDVSWPLLYGCLILALLTHILLDFTNNYGVRPFFPFSSRWYAGSIVFIFDPALFLILLSGLLLPALFALVGQEVSGRRTRSRGAGWARVALCGVLALWSIRAFEHSRALGLAEREAMQAPGLEQNSSASPVGAGRSVDSRASALPEEEAPRPWLLPQRTLASPDPLSIFRWYTVSDFGPAYRLAVADSASGTLSEAQVYTKAAPSATVKAAQNSYLGRVYLDWSSVPWISVDRASLTPYFTQHQASTVLFEDLRFLANDTFLRRGPTPPLTGYVVVAPDGAILGQGLDGKPQR